ncbi:hypothetical protein BJP34_19965 [Moorena producens PAL-8-15-08-1]|uniref:Uncharacterized protein n=1 Tax=Moorena producens PAL-8-15-08-1 TaxID=1458985 RepID=A0A1D8TV52_9CYAN|nr:hypothetical protein BJP34_19965 [Moorena producens PAL-8-15-08-1]
MWGLRSRSRSVGFAESQLVGWAKTLWCSGVVHDHRIFPTTAHKFLTRAILIQTLLIYPLLVGSAYNDYGLLI